MKILVPTKRVPDTDQRIRVNDDGSDIESNSLPFVINPFDAIALEEALRIREGRFPQAEIVAVGIGTGEYETELRTALAMGADRALLVHCEEALDPWNVARLLECLVRREQSQLVLMGKQAVDDDANQTGQFLAGLLDWPQATFASKIEFIDDGCVRVFRETDLGISVLRVQLPAVITTDLRLNEPRYASLPSILKSRKKLIERIEWNEFDLQIERRIRLIRMEAFASQRSCKMVENAGELISKLRSETQTLTPRE